MKVKHLMIFFLAFLLTGIILVKEVTKENKIYQDSYKKETIKNNRLSIMLEDTPKTGVYTVSKSGAWPNDNYIYNELLSSCESGSKLVWNESIRSVTLSVDITDKCYLYFDLYIKPTVDSLDITPTDSSISITPLITEGDYPVSKIIYKLDSDEKETTEKTYTYTGISSTVKHTIDVYAKDINGKTSKTYSYILPTITSLTSKSDLTTIEINLKTEAGTDEVTTYYYSIDNGATYIETYKDTYTFASLTEGTTYNLRVYTKDKNGIKSMQVTKTETTKKRPTNPTMNFDSTYNIVLSGSTSNNGEITYYSSTDNKTFTKGNSISLSSSATIYAYAMDSEGYKSDTISKAVTITNSTNGTVSTAYYCSKTNSYQTSSTCSYSYAATRSTDYVCSAGSYSYSKGYCTGSYGTNRDWTYAECNQTCSSGVMGGYPYSCEYNERTGGYYCSFNYGSPTISTTYSCPNGGTLSGTTCTGVTYTGTIKYKCNANNTYHDTQASATTACQNYCATGTYYNSKCYKLG